MCPLKNTCLSRRFQSQMKVLEIHSKTAGTGKKCEFKDTDDQIRNQVEHAVKSEKLRSKLLEEGKTLTSQKLQEIAQSYEAVENQMSAINHVTNTKADEVNRVSSQSSSSDPSRRKPADKSFRCGRVGHFGKAECCPARGKTCKRCRGRDHFAVVCKKKDRGKVRQKRGQNSVNFN